MQNNLRAIIFDMDGVIADSEPHWDQIDGDLLRENGVEYAGEHKAQVLGKSFPLAIEFYKQQYSLAPPLSQLMERREIIAADYYASSIPIFPDAPEVLQSLRELDLPLGMATSSVGALARPFLKRHHLEDYFDIVVSGEEVERGKPHPDIYLLAAQKLGIAPQDCLVIEDSLAGVQSAKTAGMRVAAIPDARYVDVKDYENNADFVLNNLGEVPDLARRVLPRGEKKP